MSNWNKAIEAMPQPGLRPAMVSDRSDVVDRLPPPGAAKLRAMREEVDGVRAIERATSEKLNDASASKQAAEARIRQLRDETRVLEGGDDHPAMRQAVADLEATTREVEYRQELVARHRERSRYLGGLLPNNLEPYLRRLPADMTLEPDKSISSLLRKGEKPETGLKRVRGEIENVRHALEQVRRAPIPSAEAKALMGVHVEELRRRAAPDVLALVERGDAVRWPTAPLSLPLAGVAVADSVPMIQGHARGEIPDAVGLMAWLFPDQLRARLEAEIDARSDDGAALADDDREAHEHELKAALLHAERLEEAIISLMEGSGSRAFAGRMRTLGRCWASLARRQTNCDGNGRA